MNKLLVVLALVVGSWLLWSAVRSSDPAAFSSPVSAHEEAPAASVQPELYYVEAPVSVRTFVEAPALKPRSPSSQEWTIRVRVTTSQGEELEGAALHWIQGEEIRPQGLTDAAGQGSFVARGPGVIVATLDRRASGRQLLLEQPEQEVVLELRIASSLRGVVELPDGSPAGEGLAVIAVPQDLSATLERAPIERVSRHPEAAFAWTDAAGGFVLENLVGGKEYGVVAGGEGFLLREPGLAIAGRDSFLILKVNHGYAALLRFLDADTREPARTDQGFGPRGRTTASLNSSSGLLVANYPLSAQLCFLADEFQDLAPNEQLYLAASEDRSETRGPLRFETHFAGYAAVKGETMLGSLAEGPMVTEVLLTPMTEGWGSLALTLEAPDGLVPAGRRWSTVGILDLRGEDGTVMRFPLAGSMIGTHVFSDIPHGRYGVRVFSEPDVWELPGETWVEVGDGQAELTLTATGFGAIEIELLDRNGLPFQGEACFFVGRGEPETSEDGRPLFRGGRAPFEQPPYVLPTVTPGRYSILLQHPSSVPTWSSVTVEADSVSTIALQVH